MGIAVGFGNHQITNVTSVTPADDFSSEAMVNLTTLVGHRRRSIAVRGYIRRAGHDKTLLLAEQRALTESLAAQGPATLEYPGATPFQARLRSIAWEDWTGGPLVPFTLTFEGETDNPFATRVTLTADGTEKTLDPTPAVTDTFRNTDAVDETLSASRDKTISISGVLRGTLAEVTAEEGAIKALLTSSRFFTVAVSSGTYTCTVASFSFGTPAGTEGESPKTYQIDLATLPDFSLEGRSLTGGPLTIAGVTFDVATSFSHSVGRGAGGEIASETINAGGKRFFATMALAEAFKDDVDARVRAKTTFASATGKVLAVRSVSWSEPKRDGHFADGSRRYSLSFSLSLGIDASAPPLSGVVLGVAFGVLASHSTTVSLDDEGFVTGRTQSASGKVDALPSVKAGDAVDDAGERYYLTSLNLGGADADGRRQVSVSGRTLDTAKAVEELFPSFFFGFFLDHVDSTSKSVSYAFDRCEGKFVAQAVNGSVSGFTLGSNAGVLDLIGTVNRSVGAFIITSVSTGAPDTKRRGGQVERRFPISISGVLNLVGEQKNACEEPPDVKVEETRSVEDSVARYTPVTIPGKGIVMKKIGVTQAIETVAVRHVARNQAIYASMGVPPDPASSLIGGEKVGRGTSSQGLTRGVTVKFAAYPPEVSTG